MYEMTKPGDWYINAQGTRYYYHDTACSGDRQYPIGQELDCSCISIQAKKVDIILASDILNKASSIVSGDREAQHGPKERNHQNIADHWNAYLNNRLDKPLSALDVALMMVELKIARAKGSVQMGLKVNLDNYIDMAGYAGVAGEIAINNKET